MATSTDAFPYPQAQMSNAMPNLPQVNAAGWRTATVVLLVAGLLLRIAAAWANGLELYYDEAQYWAWSRHLDFGYFSKPGMIAWLIAGTTSLCGDGAACIRLSSPIIHVLTAAAVYLLASGLYDRRVGFFSAAGYLLMPAVALSSLIVTTDVPLLFFWTLGLVAAFRLVERPSAGRAVAYGLAIALGLNAKYAMIYLPVLTMLYLVVTPERRPVLRSGWVWCGMALGLAGFLPNLYWNYQHQFVTFGHTGGNIGLAHAGLHPLSALAFLAAQLGIPGPVLLLVAAFMATGRMASDQPEADRFLLWHSLPVIVIVAGNSVFGNMNVNWAAAAYPAIVVASTAWLVQRGHRRLLALSLAIGVAASLVVGLGALAFRFVEPPRFLAQARHMVHWREFGDDVAKAAEAADLRTIVFTGRELTAQAVYVLDGSGVSVLAYKAAGARPGDHYQMTRPWSPGDPTPVLLATLQDVGTLGLSGYRVTHVTDIASGIRPARAGFVPLYRLDPLASSATPQDGGEAAAH